MSVEIKARILCDKCGSSISGPVQTKTTGMETYWDAKEEAEERRWMFNLRYGTTVHVCNLCADGTPSPEPVEIKAKTQRERMDMRRRSHLLKTVRKHGIAQVLDGIAKEMFPSQEHLNRFLTENNLSHSVVTPPKTPGVKRGTLHTFTEINQHP